MKTNKFFYLIVLVLGLLNNASHLYFLYQNIFGLHNGIDKARLILSLAAIELTILFTTLRGDKDKALIFAGGTTYLNACYLISSLQNGSWWQIIAALVWSVGYALIVLYFSDFYAKELDSTKQSKIDFEQLETKFAESEEQLARSKTDFEQLKTKFAKSEEQLAQSKTDFEQLKTKFVKSEEQLAQSKTDFEQLKTKFAKSEEQLAQSKTDFEQLKTKFAKSEEQLAQSKTDFEKMQIHLKGQIEDTKKTAASTLQRFKKLDNESITTLATDLYNMSRNSKNKNLPASDKVFDIDYTIYLCKQ